MTKQRQNCLRISTRLFNLLLVFLLFIGQPGNVYGAQTIRVISDLHIGSPWFQSPQSQSDLMGLLSTLSDPTKRGNVGVLVLLGDIIELWMDPIAVKPASLESKFAGVRYGFDISEFIHAIQKVKSTGVDVIFAIRGNHDDEVTDALYKKAFGNSVKFYENNFVLNGIRFQHGHMWDFFNLAPNPNLGRRAFGYYVSRLVSTTGFSGDGKGTSRMIKAALKPIMADVTVTALRTSCGMTKVLREILKAVGGLPYLPSFDWCHLHGDGAIVLGGSPDWDQGDVTLKNVLISYRQQMDHFIDKYGTTRTGWLLRGASEFNFDDFIAEGTESVVVMGHTHEWQLKKIKRKDRKTGLSRIVYANSGTWVDSSIHTYIDIEVRENLAQQVSIYNYNGGNPQLLQTTGVGFEEAMFAPPGWICNQAYYNASDGCDCECGVADPDCFNSTASIYNCGKRVVEGCPSGSCEYFSAPSNFSCSPQVYNALDGCHCACGVYDPDCNWPASEQSVVTCAIDEFCNSSTNRCESKPFISGWFCPYDSYNASDGCNCNCGISDPDCNDLKEGVVGCFCEDVATCVAGKCVCVDQTASTSWASTPTGLATIIGSSAVTLGLFSYLTVKFVNWIKKDRSRARTLLNIEAQEMGHGAGYHF